MTTADGLNGRPTAHPTATYLQSGLLTTQIQQNNQCHQSCLHLPPNEIRRLPVKEELLEEASRLTNFTAKEMTSRHSHYIEWKGKGECFLFEHTTHHSYQRDTTAQSNGESVCLATYPPQYHRHQMSTNLWPFLQQVRLATNQCRNERSRQVTKILLTLLSRKADSPSALLLLFNSITTSMTKRSDPWSVEDVDGPSVNTFNVC